jgi:hypothetical protein
MGYRPKRKIYNLDFTGTEYDGLKVTVRGVSTGQALDIDTARDDGSDEGMRRMLELLAEQLIDWNVEDEAGEPVPATLEGIRAQEIGLNLAVINAWQTAMAGVPDPLESGSTSGDSSLVASIPTETLSLPQSNTAVPA